MLSFWEILANKITKEPGILDIALQNIARWIADGHSGPERLLQWKDLILAGQRDPQGFEGLLNALRSTDPEAERLRDFHPFAGMLTREERRQTKELCGYRH